MLVYIMTTNQSEKINIMHACTAREKTKIERPAVRAHIQLAHPLANLEPVDEHLNKLESVFSKI